MGCEDNENMVSDLDGIVKIMVLEMWVYLIIPMSLSNLKLYFTSMPSPLCHSGISDLERRMMQELRNHDMAHRDFLKAALGSNAILTLTFDFSSFNFNN